MGIVKPNNLAIGKITSIITHTEGYRFSNTLCNELKLEMHNISSEKSLIQEKTKILFLENKFSQKFWVVIKTSDSGNLIEVYYSGFGSQGESSGPLVESFYKKLRNILKYTPEMENKGIHLTEREIVISVYGKTNFALESSDSSGVSLEWEIENGKNIISNSC